MSNLHGLCALTPVRDGHEDELREHLRALPGGLRSPMIRVPGTHYARWAIVRLEDRDGWPLESEPAYLMFCAEFDGEREPYARLVCERLGHDADDIWRHCEGYPGADPAALAAYLLDHHVQPGYSVNAFPDATVEQVRAAFALRERLNDFLVKSATLEGDALRHAFLMRFGGKAG